MNKSIKTLSLALLLCVPAAYGMKRKAITPVNGDPFTMTELFTMHDIVIPNDIVGNFFKHACSGDNINIVYEIKTMSDLFRSVCKCWYNLFQPTSIRNLFKLTPELILQALVDAEYNLYECFPVLPIGIVNMSVEKCKDNSYIKFLADMLKDQPESYNKLLKSAVQQCNVFTIKTILENGANPNSNAKDLRLESSDTPLKLATQAIIELILFYDHDTPEYQNKRTIFELLLKYGGDIHQDCGDGQTIMNIALAHCKHNPFMLESILQEKGSIHPDYQERIDKHLAMKKQESFYDSIALAVGIPMAIAFVYNVYTGAIHF